MFNFFNILRAPRSSATPFAIQKLPDLALREVIQTMDLAEQIKLSLTSKKSARIVRQAGTKFSSLKLQLGDKMCCLEVTFKKKSSKIYKISITGKEMSKLSKKESLVLTVVQACTILLNVVSQDNYSVILYPGDLKKRRIKRILESPLIQKCMNLKFKGGKLGKEVLNAIMNMDVEEKSVQFEETEFPLNFHHENAFKFKKVKYSDSRWVRVEDICSIRSFRNIEFGKSRFTSEDLNKLLHLWVNSKHDFLEGFIIQLNLRKLNQKTMFDGLTTLEIINRRHLINPRYISANSENSATRERPLLSTLFTKDRILFGTFSFSTEINRMSQYYLQRLKRKRKLEEENQNEDDYSIDKTREIEEIKNELLELGVFFVDGQAKMKTTFIGAIVRMLFPRDIRPPRNQIV